MKRIKIKGFKGKVLVCAEVMCNDGSLFVFCMKHIHLCLQIEVLLMSVKCIRSLFSDEKSEME